MIMPSAVGLPVSCQSAMEAYCRLHLLDSREWTFATAPTVVWGTKAKPLPCARLEFDAGLNLRTATTTAVADQVSVPDPNSTNSIAPSSTGSLGAPNAAAQTAAAASFAVSPHPLLAPNVASIVPLFGLKKPLRQKIITAFPTDGLMNHLNSSAPLSSMDVSFSADNHATNVAADSAAQQGAAKSDPSSAPHQNDAPPPPAPTAAMLSDDEFIASLLPSPGDEAVESAAPPLADSAVPPPMATGAPAASPSSRTSPVTTPHLVEEPPTTTKMEDSPSSMTPHEGEVDAAAGRATITPTPTTATTTTAVPPPAAAKSTPQGTTMTHNNDNNIHHVDGGSSLAAVAWVLRRGTDGGSGRGGSFPPPPGAAASGTSTTSPTSTKWSWCPVTRASPLLPAVLAWVDALHGTAGSLVGPNKQLLFLEPLVCTADGTSPLPVVGDEHDWNDSLVRSQATPPLDNALRDFAMASDMLQQLRTRVNAKSNDLGNGVVTNTDAAAPVGNSSSPDVIDVSLRVRLPTEDPPLSQAPTTTQPSAAAAAAFTTGGYVPPPARLINVQQLKNPFVVDRRLESRILKSDVIGQCLLATYATNRPSAAAAAAGCSPSSRDAPLTAVTPPVGGSPLPSANTGPAPAAAPAPGEPAPGAVAAGGEGSAAPAALVASSPDVTSANTCVAGSATASSMIMINDARKVALARRIITEALYGPTTELEEEKNTTHDGATMAASATGPSSNRAATAANAGGGSLKPLVATSRTATASCCDLVPAPHQGTFATFVVQHGLASLYWIREVDAMKLCAAVKTAPPQALSLPPGTSASAAASSTLWNVVGVASVTQVHHACGVCLSDLPAERHRAVMAKVPSWILRYASPRTLFIRHRGAWRKLEALATSPQDVHALRELQHQVRLRAKAYQRANGIASAAGDAMDDPLEANATAAERALGLLGDGAERTGGDSAAPTDRRFDVGDCIFLDVHDFALRGIVGRAEAQVGGQNGHHGARRPPSYSGHHWSTSARSSASPSQSEGPLSQDVEKALPFTVFRDLTTVERAKFVNAAALLKALEHHLC